MLALSNYADKLSSEAKERYQNKLVLIGGIDPFVIGGKGYLESSFPPVDASDLVSYLVLQTSYITAKQFKAHKSLEAYNQFTSGWVKEVKPDDVANKCVVTGKVSNAVARLSHFLHSYKPLFYR